MGFPSLGSLGSLVVGIGKKVSNGITDAGKAIEKVGDGAVNLAVEPQRLIADGFDAVGLKVVGHAINSVANMEATAGHFAVGAAVALPTTLVAGTTGGLLELAGGLEEITTSPTAFMNFYHTAGEIVTHPGQAGMLIASQLITGFQKDPGWGFGSLASMFVPGEGIFGAAGKLADMGGTLGSFAGKIGDVTHLSDLGSAAGRFSRSAGAAAKFGDSGAAAKQLVGYVNLISKKSDDITGALAESSKAEGFDLGTFLTAAQKATKGRALKPEEVTAISDAARTALEAEGGAKNLPTLLAALKDTLPPEELKALSPSIAAAAKKALSADGADLPTLLKALSTVPNLSEVDGITEAVAQAAAKTLTEDGSKAVTLLQQLEPQQLEALQTKLGKLGDGEKVKGLQAEVAKKLTSLQDQSAIEDLAKNLQGDSIDKVVSAISSPTQKPGDLLTALSNANLGRFTDPAEVTKLSEALTQSAQGVLSGNVEDLAGYLASLRKVTSGVKFAKGDMTALDGVVSKAIMEKLGGDQAATKDGVAAIQQLTDSQLAAFKQAWEAKPVEALAKDVTKTIDSREKGLARIAVLDQKRNAVINFVKKTFADAWAKSLNGKDAAQADQAALAYIQKASADQLQAVKDVWNTALQDQVIAEKPKQLISQAIKDRQAALAPLKTSLRTAADGTTPLTRRENLGQLPADFVGIFTRPVTDAKTTAGAFSDLTQGVLKTQLQATTMAGRTVRELGTTARGAATAFRDGQGAGRLIDALKAARGSGRIVLNSAKATTRTLVKGNADALAAFESKMSETQAIQFAIKHPGVVRLGMGASAINGFAAEIGGAGGEANAQEIGMAQGWLQLPSTGQMDPQTVAAVKTYQQRAGIPVTGKIDATTWQSMVGAAQAEQAQATQGQPGAATPTAATASPADQTTLTSQTTPASSPSVDPTLAAGAPADPTLTAGAPTTTASSDQAAGMSTTTGVNPPATAATDSSGNPISTAQVMNELSNFSGGQVLGSEGLTQQQSAGGTQGPAAGTTGV
jgi:hypothetical protein